MEKLKGQIDNLQKQLNLQDNIVEQIDVSIKENSDFCAAEKGKIHSMLQELEDKLAALKEEDLPEMLGSTWLDYKKDLVDLELYKTQMASMTKKLNSIEFDLQNDA